MGSLSGEAGDCLRVAHYVESWLQPDSEIHAWGLGLNAPGDAGMLRAALVCWLCGAFAALAAHSWCARRLK